MASLPPGRGRAFPAARKIAGILLTAALLLVPAAGTRAEPSGAPNADVVLVLDRSGSMQKNDPADLSATGARLFLNMLDPEDRVALVAFDTTARTLLPLAPAGDGEAARRTLEGMGRPTGQWTDIKGALQAALAVLDGQARPDRQAAVLLLTDGRPEISSDGVPPGYSEELQAMVGRAAGRSTPVFTVGLGQADRGLLGQIATGTRAEAFTAASDSQLISVFQEVLSRIKERHVVLSFEEELSPGQAGQVRTFQVPPYTRSLTLSAVGKNVRLNGQAPGAVPLGELPGLKVSEDGNYVVYSLQNPAPGTWAVQLEGTGRLEGHGQTESALRLRLTAPQPFSQVDTATPVNMTVAVTGDPDPHSPLEVWVQDGSGGNPVKLERSGQEFAGTVPVSDGHLAVWAARAGAEVSRREFRVYPTGTAARVVQPEGNQVWNLALGAAALALLAGLLGYGAWNWQRMRRRKEVVSGRLGGLVIRGTAREVQIGSGPALAQGGPVVATLTATLVPRIWAPLNGLGLVKPKLQISIRPAPGVRLQIDGRPAGEGKLFHGDSIKLGSETYSYSNPQLPRRPITRKRGMKGYGVHPSA